jgi:hypothetical protein
VRALGCPAAARRIADDPAHGIARRHRDQRFTGLQRYVADLFGLVTVWFRSLEIIISPKETEHVDQAYRRFQAGSS